MNIRHVLTTVPIVGFLAGAPIAGISSVISLSCEEASQAVSELVASVGPAFGCEITVNSIKQTSISGNDFRSFYVSFEATGVRCDEAHKVLSYRGKFKSILFLRTKKPNRKDEFPKEPNLDLIHEIDPVEK